MIYWKIGIPILLAVIGLAFANAKSSRIANLAEEVGIQEQALVQKEQAILQIRTFLAEEQAEKERLALEHKKTLEVLSQREQAHKDSLARVNTLLTEAQRLNNESPETKAWADTYHPTHVNRLLNSANHTSTGTYHDNEI